MLDTGIGMADEEQTALFDPFTRGERATAEHDGTGLGLPICQRLVRMLGGDIQIDSEPNVGTTVTFTVDPGPLDDVSLVEPSSGIERPSTP